MSAAVVDRPQLFRDTDRRIGAPGVSRRPVPTSDGGRLTLGQRLDSVWEGLVADGGAECPVCHHGAMRVEGRSAACSQCGSRVS